MNGMRVRRIVVDEREKTRNIRQDIFKLTIILYYGSQRIKKDFNLLSPVCARLLYELKLKFTSPNSILSFSISSSNWFFNNFISQSQESRRGSGQDPIRVDPSSIQVRTVDSRSHRRPEELEPKPVVAVD